LAIEHTQAAPLRPIDATFRGRRDISRPPRAERSSEPAGGITCTLAVLLLEASTRHGNRADIGAGLVVILALLRTVGVFRAGPFGPHPLMRARGDAARRLPLMGKNGRRMSSTVAASFRRWDIDG
jgi:hypothetical protein